MSTFKTIPGYENRYKISENGEIYSLVSEKLLKHYKGKRGYLVVDLIDGKGKRKICTVHRLIYKAYVKDTDKVIDHIDGNQLNNSLENLRECTNAQNMLNSRSRKGSTSSYKGVSFENQTKRWRAQIVLNGKHTSIGRFDDEINAAIAYDRKATQLFGKFARLNFPERLAA